MADSHPWFEPVVDETISYVQPPSSITKLLVAVCLASMIFIIMLYLTTDKFSHFTWEPSFFTKDKIRSIRGAQRHMPFTACDGGCSKGSSGCGCKKEEVHIV